MVDQVGIFIAITAGLLSFLSPCVLPLVPSYLSFVTGMSLEDLQEGVDRRTVMIHSALFVSGFTLIFLLMGVSASFLGQFFLIWRDWIARIGGVIIIVFGLHLMGVFRISALMREKRVHLADKPSGHMGTLAVGAAFGAGWTPCIGPVLGAILALAGTSETIWQGTGLLLAYSFGLAIPFMGAAWALDRFLSTFKRFRKWIPVIEKGSGVLLLILGLLLVTGRFTMLASSLIQFTPEWLFERL